MSAAINRPTSPQMLPLTLMAILFAAALEVSYYVWQGDLGSAPLTSLALGAHQADSVWLGEPLDVLTTICTLLFLAINADKVVMAILRGTVVNDRMRPAAARLTKQYLSRPRDRDLLFQKPIPTVANGGATTSCIAVTTTDAQSEASIRQQSTQDANGGVQGIGPLPLQADFVDGAPDMANEATEHDEDYPMVAVQLPVFNEAAVARRVIQHACAMEWPASRLIIQVLDDSTKSECRAQIDEEVQIQRANGVQVSVLRRTNRRGFKAGALNDATRALPLDVQFISLLDADFMPSPTFLQESVPYIASDETLAYVQTKWTYANGDDSLLGLVQLVNLNFHHYVEQTVRSYFGWFANFCGKSCRICSTVRMYTHDYSAQLSE